jgi:hypothetical protein
MGRKDGQHTHHDSIYLALICAVIVPIESFLAKHNGNLNCSAILGTGSYQCEVFVKVVYGRYD